MMLDHWRPGGKDAFKACAKRLPEDTVFDKVKDKPGFRSFDTYYKKAQTAVYFT